MAVTHNYLEVADKKPTPSEIQKAEIVVNLADGTLWSENGSGTVIPLAVDSGGVTSVTGGTGITSSGGTTPSISLDLSQLTAVSESGIVSTDYIAVTDDNLTKKMTFADLGDELKTQEGWVTSVGATSPVSSSGGTTPTISMLSATTSRDGYLTQTDWDTFNNKTSNTGTVTSVGGSGVISSSGGTTPSISISTASTSTSGSLTSTDWNTFNGKANTSDVTYGTLNTNGDVGTGATQVASGNHTHDSYIESTDVTYGTLNTNGDVGTSAGQLAIGNHTHSYVYGFDFSQSGAVVADGTGTVSMIAGDGMGVRATNNSVDTSMTFELDFSTHFSQTDSSAVGSMITLTNSNTGSYAHGGQFINSGGGSNSNGVVAKTEASSGAIYLENTNGTTITTSLGTSTYCIDSQTDGKIGGTVYTFTGGHGCLTDETLTTGDLVVSASSELLSVGNSLPIINTTIMLNDKRVIGIVNDTDYRTAEALLKDYAELYIRPKEEAPVGVWLDLGTSLMNTYSTTHTGAFINSIGEGGLNVCEIGGNIDNGDYLTSCTVRGKAQKQASEFLANYTVAKSLTDVVWANETVGVDGCFEKDGYKCKMIACTYHCG